MTTLYVADFTPRYNDAILTAAVYAGSTTTTTTATTTQRRRRSQRGCPDYATQNVRANNELGQVSAWLTLLIAEF
jgi:hypothetical protein